MKQISINILLQITMFSYQVVYQVLIIIIKVHYYNMLVRARFALLRVVVELRTRGAASVP